jgi:uroporphyrinogen-III decarboxylase
MKELLQRERIIRVLRHEPVDRVPVFYRMKAEAKERIARVFSIEQTGPGMKCRP